MTIQEAAYEILKKIGRPVSSKKIAKTALEQGVVTSTAKDPIQSHAQTIEKNIRDDVYNKPRLIFIHSPKGRRLIGLPHWTSSKTFPESSNSVPEYKELNANIPLDLYDKIKLAEQAKIKVNFDETVSFILKKGLSEIAPEIKKALILQLNSFNSN